MPAPSAISATTWFALIERLPKRLRDDIGLYDAMLMFYHGTHRVRSRATSPLDRAQRLHRRPGTPAREIQRRRAEIRETRQLLEQPVAARAPAAKREPGNARAPLHVTSNFRRPEYLAAVRKAKKYIRAGDIFQVVVSQRFSAKTHAEPFEIYRELRALNPSPYLFYLQMNDVAVVGSSPEMLVKVQGRDVFYRPDRRNPWRGKDEAEDQRLEREMLAERKRTRRAHHARRSGTQRSRPRLRLRHGEAEKLMTVERYSHVMHLVSSLRGRFARTWIVLMR